MQFAHFLRDIRYGSRSLRKTPGLAAAAILTLTLGIGANTAIFSVFEGVVLDPLPYHEPDRLVIVLLYNRALKFVSWLSYPDFLDWQRSPSSFEQMAAFEHQGFDLNSPGEPEHVDGDEVSASFFSTLGVKLALGRYLSPEEDRVGGPPAVIISDRLWRARFGGNPEALGKPVTLNGTDYTIVGVLSPGFRFEAEQADVYTSLGRAEIQYRNDRTVHSLACIARLKPQVSLGQARAEMNAIQDHIDAENPGTERGLGTYLAPLKQEIVGDVGGTLLLLLGAVGLVLLIACANVANLLLARAAVRTQEFAVRLALGATRAQIVRQLVTESVMLSLTGGTLGVVVAKRAVDAVLAAAPAGFPRTENIGLNIPVLLFAFGVSMAVGIIFGLVPALKSSKTDLQTGLKAGERGSTGGHQRMQRVLVVVQIALALVLLTGGSLLFRTIRNLWSVNPGFDPRHVIAFQVGLSPTFNTGASIRAAYQELIQRIRQIPGVESADITGLVPMGHGANQGPFWIGSHQPASMAEIPRAIYYPSSPDYLRTMKIPLLDGRFLARSDTIHSQLVVVIDSLLSRTYFAGEDAVGQSITIPHWGAARNVAARIVGVVGHVKHYGLDGSAGEKPQIYYSFYQLPDDAVPEFRQEVNLAVRTRMEAATAMPAIRKAIYAAGSGQPVYNVHTMQELVSGSMQRQRFPMLLLVAFALVSLLLALVGTYGVMLYSTARREHEIGIRMALGAARSDILRMVVGQGLRLAFIGVGIGAAAALVLTRALASFSHLLYGVGASDPFTFLVTSLVLIAAVVLACYVPARRSAGVDPISALRHE